VHLLLFFVPAKPLPHLTQNSLATKCRRNGWYFKIFFKIFFWYTKRPVEKKMLQRCVRLKEAKLPPKLHSSA